MTTHYLEAALEKYSDSVRQVEVLKAGTKVILAELKKAIIPRYDNVLFLFDDGWWMLVYDGEGISFEYEPQLTDRIRQVAEEHQARMNNSHKTCWQNLSGTAFNLERALGQQQRDFDDVNKAACEAFGHVLISNRTFIGSTEVLHYTFNRRIYTMYFVWDRNESSYCLSKITSQVIANNNRINV